MNSNYCPLCGYDDPECDCDPRDIEDYVFPREEEVVVNPEKWIPKSEWGKTLRDAGFTVKEQKGRLS